MKRWGSTGPTSKRSSGSGGSARRAATRPHFANTFAAICTPGWSATCARAGSSPLASPPISSHWASRSPPLHELMHSRAAPDDGLGEPLPSDSELAVPHLVSLQPGEKTHAQQRDIEVLEHRRGNIVER